MVRPHWMPRGRIHHTGVPEALQFGRFKTTSQDRIRYAVKEGNRKTRSEQIQQFKLKKPKELTRWQKQAGARKIA